MQSNKVFDNNAENSYQTPPVFVYLSSLFFASLITKNDRLLHLLFARMAFDVWVWFISSCVLEDMNKIVKIALFRGAQ